MEVSNNTWFSRFLEMWFWRCGSRDVVTEMWLQRCGSRDVVTETWFSRTLFAAERIFLHKSPRDVVFCHLIRECSIILYIICEEIHLTFISIRDILY